MNRSILIVAASPLIYFPACYAEQTTTNVDETIVITANRLEQSTTSTLADVEVVTKEEFDLIQAKSIPDVLRRLTGIQIIQNGGRGQNTSIIARGTGASQVLVLVDGVRFARAAKGSVDFNQIPLTYVERIEYVKGARASLYGSEAIGGVINIITVARSKQQATKINAGLGSLDYQQLSLASGVATSDNGQLNLALGYEGEDGYNVHPVSGVNDGDEHGFETLNGLVGYNHQLSNNWSLFTNVRAYQNIYQYDSSYSSRAYYEAEKDHLSISLGGRYQTSSFTSELHLNTQNQDEWNYEQEEGKDSGTQGELSQQVLQWSNSYVINDSVTLGGGVDLREESYTDVDAGESYDRSNSAAYSLLSLQGEKALAEISARLDDNEEYGDHSTYNIGAGYQFIPEFGIKASYGTAFKAPNLYQLYDPTYGSEDLEPEESQSLELGVSGIIDGFYWSVTGYDYQIDNLIDFDYGTYTYQNVDGESRIKGLEVVAEFDTGIVQHQLSADWKKPEDENGDTLNRRADTIYKWNGIVDFDAVSLSLSYLYVAERPDSYSDTGYLDPYHLVDSSISYYANEKTTISLRVSNLFDEEYETASGYPSAERAYYLNVAYQID